MKAEKKDKMARLRETLTRALRVLDEVEITPGQPHRPQLAKIRVLQRIAEEGGSVTTQHLWDIAREVGYDLRGLGGFFHGRQRTLERTPDRMNCLTTAGRQLVASLAHPLKLPLPPLIALPHSVCLSDAVIEERREGW